MKMLMLNLFQIIYVEENIFSIYNKKLLIKNTVKGIIEKQKSYRIKIQYSQQAQNYHVKLLVKHINSNAQFWYLCHRL